MRHSSVPESEWWTIDKCFATQGYGAFSAFVIDEAHLFCSWASFRPACSSVLRWLRANDAPKLLLSATVTAMQVRREWGEEQVAQLVGLICLALEAVSEYLLDQRTGAHHGTDHARRSLAARVHMRCGEVEYDYSVIVDTIRQMSSATTVVLCAATFQLMRDLVTYLRANAATAARFNDAASVASFHGLVDGNEKSRVFELGDRLRVLITNGCFSHGLDLKPRDGVVVFVIGSFDTKAMMAQALGRASRDGRGAVVHLIARSADLTRAAARQRKEAQRLDDASKSLRGDNKTMMQLRSRLAIESAEELQAFCDNIGALCGACVCRWRDAVALCRRRRLCDAGKSTTQPICLVAALLENYIGSPSDLSHCTHKPLCSSSVINAPKPKVASEAAVYYLGGAGARTH